jgi:hypothetical protein
MTSGSFFDVEVFTTLAGVPICTPGGYLHKHNVDYDAMIKLFLVTFARVAERHVSEQRVEHRAHVRSGLLDMDRIYSHVLLGLTDGQPVAVTDPRTVKFT